MAGLYIQGFRYRDLLSPHRLAWCYGSKLISMRFNDAYVLFFLRTDDNLSAGEHETKFRLFMSQHSEIFWKHVELVNEFYGHVLTLRPSLLQGRAQIYTDAFKIMTIP